MTFGLKRQEEVMAQKRLSVRKIREILRLKLGEKRNLRDTGQSVGISASVAHDCLKRFEASGLEWPLEPSLDDDQLESTLYVAPGTKPSRKVVRTGGSSIKNCGGSM